jgi:hypothetical protein
VNGKKKMPAVAIAHQQPTLYRDSLNQPAMQKIITFLWFDNQAEQAMNFYVSVFKNSKVGKITRYGDAGPGPKGSVMTANFQLEGQEFMALNGGPQFPFTEAISLVRQLRIAAGSRRSLGETIGWGKTRPVWLAERQVRSILANHPHCPGRGAE